ncbi:MAG TPA: MFS transporter [Thermoplasmata archaeon]|nr:MFS transporter [Thermoplasmata archaeon]
MTPEAPVAFDDPPRETDAHRVFRTGLRHQGLAVAVVLGIMLCLLMGALDNFVVLTALPNILSDLRAPTRGETFIVSAYLISSTVAIPIFAKLSDLFDRKRVLLAGLVIFIGGSILSGVSQTFNELVFFRAVQGFGSGDFFPVGLSIVAVIFPPETRARVTGLLSGVFGIATVAGPLLGAAIVNATTWRWVFYVNIPVGLAGLILLLAALGPIRPERKGSFDVPGAALLAAWVGSLMFALIEVSEGGWAWTDPRVIALLASAVVLVVGFVGWETLRARDPLVPLRLFSRRIVAASGGTTFIVGMVVFPLATFLTLFVTYVTLAGGGDASNTVRDVLYFLVIPLVFGAAIGGNLLTRLAYRPVVVAGLLISTVGLVYFTMVGVSTPTWKLAFGFLPVGGVVAPLIPIGFGVGMTFPVFLLAVQNQVPEADVGAASGLVQFLQSLGGSIGLTLLSSFQQSRFLALLPAPPVGGCAAPPSAACIAYGQAVVSSTATSFVDVFTVMLVLTVIGLLLGLFVTGRLPKGAKPIGGGR